MAPELTGSNVADAQTLWTPGMLNNGVTNDKPRGNTQGTLLASAARTVTTTAPKQINYNAKGVIVWLRVSTAGTTGGLVLRIMGYDPVTGAAYQLTAAPTAVSVAGFYAYELYPGIGVASGEITQRTNAALPREWTVTINAADTASYTYSVGYSLIL